MTNDTSKVNSTSTKAFREMTENLEVHAKRIRIMEQQFLDLSARMNSIEDSRQKIRATQ